MSPAFSLGLIRSMRFGVIATIVIVIVLSRSFSCLAQAANDVHIEDAHISKSTLVTGNSNKVEVNYYERKVTVYDGPDADTIRRGVVEALKEHEEKLIAILTERGEEDFIHAALEEALAQLAELKESDRANAKRNEYAISLLEKILGAPYQPHRAYLGLSAAGAYSRLDGQNRGTVGVSFDVMFALGKPTEATRVLLGAAIDAAYLYQREQTVAPNGRELRSDAPPNFLLLGAVPLEVWFGPRSTHQFALRGAFALGTQYISLQREPGSLGFTWGGRVGLEYRINLRRRGDYRIFRLGLDYSPTRLTVARVGFEGFEPTEHMSRHWKHFVRVTVGCLFGAMPDDR